MNTEFIDYNYAVDEILEVAPPPVGLEADYELEVPMRKRDKAKDLAKRNKKVLTHIKLNDKHD